MRSTKRQTSSHIGPRHSEVSHMTVSSVSLKTSATELIFNFLIKKIDFVLIKWQKLTFILGNNAAFKHDWLGADIFDNFNNGQVDLVVCVAILEDGDWNCQNG